MTVKDIQSLIPAAIARFKERIPQSAEWIDTIPIKIATYRTCEKMFYDTIASLKAWEKPFSPQTTAEAFTGENGYAVIVYQYKIQSAAQFNKVLWHELGHILSNINNRALEEEGRSDILQRRFTPLAYAQSIWTEFIASAIANYVENRESSSGTIAWALQDQLSLMADEAINDGRLFYAALGHYFGYLLTDIDVISMIDYYTSEDSQPSIGLDKYPEAVQSAMIDINNAICAYLAESGYYGDDTIYGSSENASQFWRIPRETLEQIGKLVETLDVEIDSCFGRSFF